MPNFIITYNISRTDKGDKTAAEFETILQEFKFKKQISNQSTYFGNYATKESLYKDLFNATQSKKLVWAKEDNITIYYPMVNEQKRADIGKHEYKKEGNDNISYPI